MDIKKRLHNLSRQFGDSKVTLVAVTKTFDAKVVLQAYNAGHRDFGENKVQEMVEKAEVLPGNIHWHMIGHLQRNKVKYIAPFVHLIHSIDTERLLNEVDKQARKAKRVIDCLLQVHIAEEDTKFGFSYNEVRELIDSAIPTQLEHVRICGLMGMATNTDNEQQVRAEFKKLHKLFTEVKEKHFSGMPYFNKLSMGMSSDYKIAIEEGSNIVRVGTLIFGSR